MLALDGLEAGGDPCGPILVAGEEDVLGQLAWPEADVVLPFARRERDAVVRVRQAPASSSFARGCGTRASVGVVLNVRQLDSCSAHARATLESTLGSAVVGTRARKGGSTSAIHELRLAHAPTVVGVSRHCPATRSALPQSRSVDATKRNRDAEQPRPLVEEGEID